MCNACCLDIDIVAMQCKDRAKADTLALLTSEIASLTSSSEVTVQEQGATAPAGCAPAVIDDSTTAQLLLAGILDPQKEIEKLQKEKVKSTHLKTCTGVLFLLILWRGVCNFVSSLLQQHQVESKDERQVLRRILGWLLLLQSHAESLA